MGVLLDTSVLIAAERGELDLRAAAGDTEIAIAAVTAHELWRGAGRLRAAVPRMRAERWLEALLDLLPVVPYDQEVARVHAALGVDLSRRGRTLGPYEQMIAATALHLDFELATRDHAFALVPGLTIRRW
ncbi:MAG TPA: PIN domain-containing protein [Vicinamibacterales bacterium]|nr:PIN domain-containing protein [Vicinamibacterales bacterium]